MGSCTQIAATFTEIFLLLLEKYDIIPNGLGCQVISEILLIWSFGANIYITIIVTIANLWDQIQKPLRLWDDLDLSSSVLYNNERS